MKFAESLLARMLLVMISIDTVLVIAHAVSASVAWFPGSNLFDLDREQSIGTWWSANQLFIAGALLGVAATSAGNRLSVSRRFLWLLALGFVFLSLDEFVSIHERVTQFRNEYAQWMPVFNSEGGAWIFVYALLGLVLMVLNRKHIGSLWIEHKPASVAIGSGFLLLVVGGVCLEIAGRYYGLIQPDSLQVGLEEYFEMIGGSIIVYGCALLLQDLQKAVKHL